MRSATQPGTKGGRLSIGGQLGYGSGHGAIQSDPTAAGGDDRGLFGDPGVGAVPWDAEWRDRAQGAAELRPWGAAATALGGDRRIRYEQSSAATGRVVAADRGRDPAPRAAGGAAGSGRVALRAHAGVSEGVSGLAEAGLDL